MTDEFELLTGVDEPRPLPAALRRRLEWTLTGEDSAVIALSDADGPRPLPADMADRVAAAVATDAGVAMPAPVRRRIERTLTGRPAWSRAIAVAAALLFVLASATIITANRQGESGEGDKVAAGPQRTEERQPTTTEPAQAMAAEDATPPAPAPTTAPALVKRAQTTTTTTAGESAASGGGAAAAAPSGAAAGRAAPRVTVTPSTARRGEEVAARAEGFSTTTLRYRLQAPSGRVVLEGDAAAPEFRFTVPLVTENGRHVLTVEGGGDSAQAPLDVVA